MLQAKDARRGLASGLQVGAALGALLLATAAHAQGSYPYGGYPPGYGSYPAQPAPSQAAPSQYADPRYSDPRYSDPRYSDPRYQAWLRWYYQRYYGQAFPTYPAPVSTPARPPAPPAPVAVAAAPQALAAPPEAPAASPALAVSPPPPSVTDVAAAEATPLPPPRLPHRLIEAAQAYAEYVKNTSGIQTDFKSGASVAAAVKTAAAYEPHQFQEGAIAYAALTALQEPSFVQAVRQQVQAGDRGAGFAAELRDHPEDALSLQGADLAAARAATALRRHGEHLVNAGADVKKAAYTVQHSEWSKTEVSDPDGRLAAAKVSSALRRELKGDEAPELVRAILAEPAAGGQAVGSPIVTRGLAIAALAALGQFQGDDDPRLAALIAEPASADCLKMAKLNLFQCLAVARPHYEDIFCLGEHGMRETGQCVVRAAGYSPIPQPPVAMAAGAKVPSR